MPRGAAQEVTTGPRSRFPSIEKGLDDGLALRRPLCTRRHAGADAAAGAALRLAGVAADPVAIAATSPGTLGQDRGGVLRRPVHRLPGTTQQVGLTGGLLGS